VHDRRLGWLIHRVFDRSAFVGRAAWHDYLVTVLSVALTTAVLAPLRERLDLLNVGLMFRMLVILVAARWGWGPAIFASVVANPGRVLSHRDILREGWDPEYTREFQYLRTIMASLRRKLERDAATPVHLVTEPGAGDRFRVFPD
jgi:hypothetical protein